MRAGRAPGPAPEHLEWRQATRSWEEGSHLKEYPFKWTGGTGKYEGARGGGTYTYENLTDTLSAGRYKGKMELP